MYFTKHPLTMTLTLALCIATDSFCDKTEVYALQGSITDQDTEAIVNAANPQLQGGDGVCGAIFKAAGWNQLQAACNKYPAIKGVRCPVGEARITDSFQLSDVGIKNIIHAVGPDARIVKDQNVQRALLESAYTSSLQLATDNELTSISFPFISSGIYAVDHQLAAEAAVTAVRNFIQDNETTLTEIRFVLLYKKEYQLFQSLLNDKKSRQSITAASCD